MLVDLLAMLVKTIIAGLLKLWWLWLILIFFVVIIFLLKKKSGNHQKGTNNLTNKNRCPSCGGYLKRMPGKYGAFYGCSNFPKCTYKHKL